ncbi:hypothetical protein KI387_033508 [Taxus chinensis]|uniref:BTB domain-containing protein n=1 Tax=Taxus chinensis TaxID=29808 RepID=A0AA38F530_TAXCH|nr:hypothetical protein KI387_033508 [Taxus chinensis]
MEPDCSRKRKNDIQGESSSSSDRQTNKRIAVKPVELVSSTSADPTPIPLTPEENARKHIKAIKDLQAYQPHEIDKARFDVIQDICRLQELLVADSNLADLLVLEEGIVPHIISVLSIKPPQNYSGPPKPYENIIEQSAAILLNCIAEKSSVYRDLIREKQALPPLFLLLRREAKDARDKIMIALFRSVLTIIKTLAVDDPPGFSIIALDNDCQPIFRATLNSADTVVRVLTLDIIHLFVTNSRVFTDRFCDYEYGAAFVDLHVLLGCGYMAIQVKAAMVISAMLGTHRAGEIVLRFTSDGIALEIVQMLSSEINRARLTAAKLVRLFIEQAPTPTDLPGFTEMGVQYRLIEMIKSNIKSLQINGVRALHTIIETDQGVEDSFVHAGGIQALMNLFFESHEIGNYESLSNHIIRSLFLLATKSARGFVIFIQRGGLGLLKRTPFYYRDARQSAINFWESLKNVLIPNNYESDTEEGDIAQFNYPHRALVDRALLTENEDTRARIAYALALWVKPRDYQKLFVQNNLLESLLRLYGSSDRNEHYDGAEALYILVNRSRKYFCPTVVVNGEFLGWAPPVILDRETLSMARRHVSNKNYDVKFLLDNQTKEFNAHKAVLKYVSKRFGLMLGDWGNKGDTSTVIIKDVRHIIFVSVMKFIYTGEGVLVDNEYPDYLYELYAAAHYFDMDPLMRLCAHYIALNCLTVETIEYIYELADLYETADSLLKESCIFFMLEHHQQLYSQLGEGFSNLTQRTIPEIKKWIPRIFTMPPK